MKPIREKFLFTVAVGFGLGYGPVAPGTWGSLIPLVFFLIWGGNSPWFWLIAGIFILLSVPAANLAARKLQAKDPRKIVVDEVAGQFLTLLFLPFTGWIIMVAGFLAFRFFDIVKPPPARRAESLPAGWGIVLDDVVAGIYANILLQLLFRIVYPLLSFHLAPWLTLT